MHLLEKERNQPGSVIGADFEPFFVGEPPQGGCGAQSGSRTGGGGAARADRQDPAKLDAPAAESLSELVAQGVSLAQIARMKKTSKDAIRRQCQAEGLSQPADDYDAPQSDFAPDRNEAQQRRDEAGDRVRDKRQASLAEKADGNATSAIAEVGDDFGGAIDGMEEEPQRRSAKWSEPSPAGWTASATSPATSPAGIKAEGGPDLRAGDVKRVMGQLKGDPQRFAAALA